jgi:hypothetical protein
MDSFDMSITMASKPNSAFQFVGRMSTSFDGGKVQAQDYCTILCG